MVHAVNPATPTAWSAPSIGSVQIVKIPMGVDPQELLACGRPRFDECRLGYVMQLAQTSRDEAVLFYWKDMRTDIDYSGRRIRKMHDLTTREILAEVEREQEPRHQRGSCEAAWMSDTTDSSRVLPSIVGSSLRARPKRRRPSNRRKQGCPVRPSGRLFDVECLRGRGPFQRRRVFRPTSDR